MTDRSRGLLDTRGAVKDHVVALWDQIVHVGLLEYAELYSVSDPLLKQNVLHKKDFTHGSFGWRITMVLQLLEERVHPALKEYASANFERIVNDTLLVNDFTLQDLVHFSDREPTELNQ